MNYTIGIAEMKTTDCKDDVLVTYSLGSCIGLALYDPAACVGGIVHCMLPLSKIDEAKASQNPMMFMDTGVGALLQEVFNLGAQRHRLIAKAAGGSSIMDEKGIFRIGERNTTVLRKMLWRNNILLAAEDLGGSASRTMYLHMDAGRTVIKSCGTMREL